MVDVIFMGTPDYASAILEHLIADDDINVKAVYTQPDKPVGRKKVMTPPIVKEVAQAHNIAIYQPERLRDEAVVNELKTIKTDMIIVAAYGQILPKTILDYAPCINLHASILPKYRGASPIQYAILHGESKTGVTAMLMDEGLDTGDILKISEVEIPTTMMVSELFTSLTKVACELTIEVIKNFNALTPIAQDDSLATHCGKISKADGKVEFDDAMNLYNRYRAFTPWPGIYLESGLKLKEIALNEYRSDNDNIGQIIQIKDDSIIITCKKGSIEIFRVQPSSKKEMGVLDYINGKRVVVGDTLS